jgi:hypothetical protein
MWLSSNWYDALATHCICQQVGGRGCCQIGLGLSFYVYNVVWDLSDNPLLYLLVGDALMGVGVYDDWPNFVCLRTGGWCHVLTWTYFKFT